MYEQADRPGANGDATFAAYERHEGDVRSGCLLICDHASNALPSGYGTLGLSSAELERHIAYDIGAAAVTRNLSQSLMAPAVLSCFSRLLIDPNRGADDPTLVMRISDGAIVPGNATIDAAEIARRIARYYEPYHGAIDGAIDAAVAVGHPPLLLSIHSFTEAWKGRPRPWHATVLWDKDHRLALPLVEALRQEDDLVIGENEPYSGQLRGDTLYRHGTHRGLAHALIEIRQDLIREEAGQREWAERLQRVMGRVLGRAELAQELRVIRYYGSHTDDDGPVSKSGPVAEESRNNIMTEIDQETRTELEAAVFRRLVDFLRGRTDVQNIDLMNLAGFCRNCLSNWYRDAAEERGIELTKDSSREIIYGMPFTEWKAKYQTEVSPEKLERFEEIRPRDGH
ncbi:MAG: DUF1244 domain-containing protein [Methyloligellaceae bacterium]